MNVALAGGGTHPFQKWSDRKIYPTERFLSVSEKYGFLAKQFTVFGQHVHIGCASADDAIYLNARADPLRAAFHRARGVEPVLPGCRHGVRFVAAVDRQRVSAVGNDAARALVGRVQPLLRPDARPRHRREHEGLLLGHPAEARIRHRRDPRVRHAAHRRSRRADRGVRAGARALAVGGAQHRRSRPTSICAQPQPLPGVPPRFRRHAGRRDDGTHAPARRRPARNAAQRSRRTRRCSIRRTAFAALAGDDRRRATTPRGCAARSRRPARCPTSCAGSRNCGRRRTRLRRSRC